MKKKYANQKADERSGEKTITDSIITLRFGAPRTANLLWGKKV